MSDRSNEEAVVGGASHVQRLEAELRHAQRMEAVGRLAGGMAHDLNNVLTVIQSFGELALAEVAAASAAHEHVSQMLAATQRAATLTRQLLAFSRRQPALPRVVTFNEIVLRMNPMLCRIVGEDLDVVLRLVPEPWTILVDPSHFEQVLMNLVVNARDAMRRGGTLTIETSNASLDKADSRTQELSADGEYAVLTVSDTGFGIPSALQEKIFEPFFTTKDQTRGTGLGLSTCYGIVKQAGGHIFLESVESVGSTFRVCVPRTRERRRPTTGVNVAVDRVDGHETILLAEDDDTVRALLVQSLRGFGYEVVPARNGRDALGLLEGRPRPVDVLVSDVVMPEMSGPELAARLKARWPELKVLFISGYADDELSRYGVQASDVALLAKPFTMSRLAASIREVLASGS